LRKYPELGLVFTDFRKVVQKNGTQTVWRENDLSSVGFLEKIAFDSIKARDGDIYIFSKKIFYELVLFCFIWTGTVMIPRKVFSEIGYFDEELRIAEDHDLWLRIAGRYEICFRSLNTATYILHDGGITKNIPLYYDSSIKVRSRYLDPHYELPVEYVRRLKKQLSDFFFIKGYYFYNLGEFDKAGREFRKSIAGGRWELRCVLYYLLTFLPAPAIQLVRRTKQCISPGKSCEEQA